MPWFRVDDGFHSHPKVLATSLAARGLWATAGSWSSDHLTDGFVGDHVLASLGGSPELAAELVTAGLWKRRRNGWQFHDWARKNPTREEVEKERKDAAERQRRRRGRQSGGDSFARTLPSETPVDNCADTPVDTHRRSSDANSSRRDSRSDTAVSHTTPSRRDGSTKDTPIPSRANGRASPPGSPDRAAKPPWCGECDERTRMVGDPDKPGRCPRCHPMAQAEAVPP